MQSSTAILKKIKSLKMTLNPSFVLKTGKLIDGLKY